MIIGYRTFICDDCKNRFKSIAMEYACTCIPAPVRCPMCGSWHTYTTGLFGGLVGPSSAYRKIWAERDKMEEMDTAARN